METLELTIGLAFECLKLIWLVETGSGPLYGFSEGYSNLWYVSLTQSRSSFGNIDGGCS
jgi:hypothetical protein